jgi:hypothetical protein
MRVTGFTFIRNAVKYDYPVVEAIKSILPICDNFVVAVGNSDDNTLDLIQSIDKQKIRIIETIWDDSLEMKKGGKVFARETDKAFQAISMESDWAFYIQGDEVVHEKYLDSIYSSMEKWKDDKKVDGLLFNYLHFYGSYDYTGLSPKWYGHEIRVIKNNKSIYSFRDAQGFRKSNNEKLNVKPIDAFIYHYGWVKEPGTMMKKAINANSFYQDKHFLKRLKSKESNGSKEFDYSSIDSLSLFTETHPKVMEERIRRKNWTFEHDISFNRLSLRYRGKIFIKKYLGINTYYENYQVI